VIVALGSLERGLGKLEIDTARIAAEIGDEQAWEVLAEAIQTLMRRHALERPYERLKELTRGRAVNRKTIEEFVAELPLGAEAKAALLRLEPRGYLGFAAELVERFTPREGPKSRP
jgi:adenylosuccinate lyase